MAMYAIGMMHLQDEIGHEKTRVKQVAYADDLTGAGKISDLKTWWERISSHGPKLGYHPNASKSILLVKPEGYDHAKKVFEGSEIVVTKEGERHLGAVIGTDRFKEQYVAGKVEEWVKEIKVLSEYAKTQPQAAYAAYTYGVKHKWNYTLRTINNIKPQLEPLEKVIREELIPTLTNRRNITDVERKVLELPPRMGGLGIVDPRDIAEREYENSRKLTASVRGHIVEQNKHGEVDNEEVRKLRYLISRAREMRQKEKMQDLDSQLADDMKRRIASAQEVGASNWLTALPIKEKGFSLNKREFTDAISLRYGWPIDKIPKECVCGEPFHQDHAMKCKKGGFVCRRHDEVRDITVQMLREVCRDVSTEPELIPLTGETLRYLTANTSNEARVDASAGGFWERGQRAYFDIRIFYPMAPCHRNLTLEAAHIKNEQDKRRAYEERIINVDQGSFTPLIFTTSGGMGPRAQIFYARLAELMAARKRQPRSSVTAWLRCRLSFSLLRSAILCLRGTRSPPPPRMNMEELDAEREMVDCRIEKEI